jgi:hypothetical protein
MEGGSLMTKTEALILLGGALGGGLVYWWFSRSSAPATATPYFGLAGSPHADELPCPTTGHYGREAVSRALQSGEVT